MEFNLIKLVLTIKIDTNITDPYALFKIRGEVRDAFRRVVKCQNGECEACRASADCPYNQNFSQLLSIDKSALQRFQKPSLPFIFEFPLLPPAPNRGTIIECGLILAGAAINHLNLYLEAFRLLLKGWGGRKIFKGNLVSIATCDYHGGKEIVMVDSAKIVNERLHLLSAFEIPMVRSLDNNQVTLSFLTPLRLIQNGKPVKELPFAVLIRSLLRRVSSLAYYYGGEELQLHYKWLSEQSAMVETVHDELCWHVPTGDSGRDRLSGLIGTVTYGGNLSDYHLLLLVGEYFHLGKGAAFGLGQFRLE
jgi:hypothetical protein